MQWVLLLFGGWLIFLCVRGLLEKRAALAEAKAAAAWPSTEGRVLSVAIIEGSSISSETKQRIFTYRPEIRYGYRVNNVDFESTRIAFGKVLYYDQAEAQAFLAAHAEGAPVTVYHNPSNPNRAVLNRDPALATQLVAADFAMLGFGLALAALAIFVK